jgi:hypothetical protein
MDKDTLAYVEAGGLVLVVFGIPIFVWWRLEKKRAEKESAVAASLGATFRRKGTQQDIAALLGNSHVASHGNTLTLSNLIEFPATDDRNIKLFDYFYCIGTGKNSTGFEQTIFRMESPSADLPEFLLHPESVFFKAAKALGAQDIDFPDFPEFNKMFSVQGADEDGIREVFTPDVIQFCQNHPGIILEGNTYRLLVYRSAKRVKPEVLTGFLDQGKQIGSLIFDAIDADDARDIQDAADDAGPDEPPIPISAPPPLPPPLPPPITS